MYTIINIFNAFLVESENIKMQTLNEMEQLKGYFYLIFIFLLKNALILCIEKANEKERKANELLEHSKRK